MQNIRLLQGVAKLTKSFVNLSIKNENLLKNQYPLLISSYRIDITEKKATENIIQWRPKTIFVKAPLIYKDNNPLKEIIDRPLSNKIIESPIASIITEINDIINKKNEIKTPSNGSNNKIYAARLIVIRRRKMKKHKLKKLRKKMKFEWAKVRQRREMRKEKAFQAELLAQIREAEKFSAEIYVAEKLRQATETPIPRLWKGKRLPQFIIKQKLGIK